MLPRSPITAAAGFLAAGLLGPGPSHASALLSAAASLALIVAGLGASLRGSHLPPAPRPLPAAALFIPMAFLPLGWFLVASCDLGRSPDQIARLLAREPALRDGLGTIEGVVSDEPRPRPAPE